MIAKFLATLKQKGWKQQQIAEILEIRQAHVSRLFKGDNCSVDVVLKLADYFEVSTDEVLGRKAAESIKAPVIRNSVASCRDSTLTS